MKRKCFYFLALQFMLPLALNLITSCLANRTPPNLTTDQAALLAFKNHITSDPYDFLSKNWSVSSSVCDWIGVTCRHSRVAALNIPNIGLTGTLPSHLGNLSFLVSLTLSDNHFRGTLPPELAHLRRLKTLTITNNDFTGGIPTWFGSMTELRALSLSSNSFSGLIPPSLSNLSKLEFLSLSYNSLQGSVPPEIANLHSLVNLNFSYNKLSGSLSPGIFNISTLEVIGVMKNFLSGNIPHDLCGRLPSIWYLGISFNQFSGRMPQNLSQCSKLQHLSLSYNNFTAAFIPEELGSLGKLEELFLDGNNLRGVIPKEFGNLTALKILSLQDNNLTGEIPSELGKLNKLEILQLRSNNLRGQLPMEVFNFSAMRSMNLNSNFIEGHLPSVTALPNLINIQLHGNYLTGAIPSSISNCSKIVVLELSGNRFVGSIPYSLGGLKELQVLNVAQNNLASKSSSQELDFFTFLSKCEALKSLWVDDNPMDGLLPASIGNLSVSVESISANNCNLRGRIPSEIGNLSSLFRLRMFGNQFTGSIPSTIQGVSSIQSLNLANNKLTGIIPQGICALQKLTTLNFIGNHISGPILDCLGNVSSLRLLFLSSNEFNSIIPTNLMNLKDLLSLNLSSNFITGSLPPDLGNLEAANEIDMSMNNLSGDIPRTVADLKNLQVLSLAHNMLYGSIPGSIDKVVNLRYLDLSHNNLSGSIPKSLEKLQYLKYLNVSFNQLTGEIPRGGPFQNMTSDSFAFNEALCGAPKFKVTPCPAAKINRSKTRKVVLLIVFLLVGITGIVGLLILGVYVRYRKQQAKLLDKDALPLTTLERISYYELQRATDNYAESNLLGAGTFGRVYKGNLSDGRVVAVKVFNLQVEGACKSFQVECEVLRNLRHRNLTKVISSCSNPDFKALVLEFIPNGSLEKWLYSPNYFLDIKQRLNIMIDVAQALEYLHFGNPTPVIHCDLKPSNILVDENLVAHVSDFGIAKLFDQEQSKIYTGTLATFGYVAPEYGFEGVVSTRSDVYSYGILLMEVFTRKRPTDEMFNGIGSFSLRDWVNDSVSNSVSEIVDANLIVASNESHPQVLKCLSHIFQVALNCSAESPKNRISIEEVLVALNKIQSHLGR